MDLMELLNINKIKDKIFNNNMPKYTMPSVTQRTIVPDPLQLNVQPGGQQQQIQGTIPSPTGVQNTPAPTPDPMQFNIQQPEQIQGTIPSPAGVQDTPSPTPDTMQFNIQQPEQIQGTIPSPTGVQDTPSPTPDTMQFDIKPSTPNANSGIFSGNNGAIGDQYRDTLSGALSGSMYDPFAAGSKEAMARSEANRRAGTAAQIAKAGFTGQGIGSQIANATENDITKNRFDTNIGIEQARNASRVSALSEARAFGNDETSQAWKTYEKALDMGSDADVIAAYKNATGNDLDPRAVSEVRGYARTKREQELTVGEQGITLKDLEIDAEKAGITSEQMSNVTRDINDGVPLSVINQKYGTNFTDADYSSMSEKYKQGIEKNNLANEAERVDLETARTNLETLKRTQAGVDFVAYLDGHLNEGAESQSVIDRAQKLWEAQGKTGTVPPEFVKEQVDAARDIRLTNSAAVFDYQIDQLVDNKYMTEEDGIIAKAAFKQNIFDTEFWSYDPATGKVTFDREAYAKSMSEGLPGADTTSKLTKADIPEGKEAIGSIFTTEDNKVYKVGSDDIPVSMEFDPDDDDVWGYDADKILAEGGDIARQIAESRASDIADGKKNWRTITGVDDPVYKSLLDSNTGTNGYGDNGTVNPAGANNDRHSLTNLEDAYNSKTFIRKDGKLYVVIDLNVVDKNWKNWTKYTLTEIGTKGTIGVTAKG